VSEGVDYVGFNFWPKSRRFIAPPDAGRLAGNLPRDVKVVALFVDPKRTEVDKVLDEMAVDLLQFHGSETATFCQAFGVPFMKAIRLKDERSLAMMGDYLTQPDDYMLVDTYVAGAYGGTGHPVSLELAIKARERYPSARLFLAGGLEAGSVGDAIRQVNPYGVDVASSVERSAGDKSSARVRAFVRAVRRAKQLE
jgi:phosphoribosylanthranilate isomerase